MIFGDRPLAVANDDLFSGADFLQILSEAVSQVRDVGASHPGLPNMAMIATFMPLRGGNRGVRDPPVAMRRPCSTSPRSALDAVCVTDNVAEFKRVPALKVENWLR
jgi:hypothetical protein